MVWRAVALAVGLLLGGVACGSSSGTGGSIQDVAKPVASTSAKANISSLNDEMLLTQSGFPSSAVGEFKVTATNHFDPMGEVDACSPVALIREGGQRARAKLKGESTYLVTIYRTGTTHDLRQWAGRCFPATESNSTTKLVELPGLSAGAVGVVIERGDRPQAYQAMGYIRGVFVDAKVDGLPEAPVDAKSDVVKLFNNQAELLNSY